MEHIQNILKNPLLPKQNGNASSASPGELTTLADCPQCDGTGWTQAAFGAVESCSVCQPLRRRQAALASLPKPLHAMTFAVFKPGPGSHKGYDAALAFAHNTLCPWLLLAGDKGTGKTHLAVATILERAEHSEYGDPGRFIVYPELLAELRIGVGDGTMEMTLASYKRTPLLVLDDLGTEYRKGDGGKQSWSDEQLYRLLVHRYNNALPTLMTTNVPTEALDPRIADRLLHKGFCQVVVMQGQSHRSGRTW